MAFFAALCGSGCAPLPVNLYVADADAGRIVYSTCTINKNVPDGVMLAVDGVHLRVRLMQAFGPAHIEARLEVPPQRTVVLDDGVFRFDRRDGSPPLEARIPNVSLVDTPSINSFSGSPALAKYMVPIRTPLVGGEMRIGQRTWDKNYWMAARVDTQGARDVWVTLPGFTVDDVPAALPTLHFHRELFLVLAPFNC